MTQSPRMYAARLLLETNHVLPANSFLALAKHQDYLVRQEAYMILGEYNNATITNFLKNAAVTEANISAARAARLALNKQQIDTLQGDENEEEALSLLLNTEDEQECWQGIQIALSNNEYLGVKALKSLASSDSELQETAVAQLIALQYTKDSIVPEPQFPENKHAITIHETLAHYNVTLHNSLLLPSPITPDMESLFTQADINEDSGIQPLTHAWNPLTGRGFLRQHGFGGSAQEYASRLLSELDSLCSNNNITLKDQDAGWQLAGRLFHLLQDMTSPLHVFTVWHVFHGHFETYWAPFVAEALATTDVWNSAPLSLPDIPQAAVFHLDDHTRSALEQRVTNLPNTLSAYQEALAWCTYYRASFWGEIRYAEQASSTYTLAATFDDGITEALPNVLDLMFDHNIRYHTSWLNDYFEITDRKGNTFTWNRMFALDDWRPCSNPQNKQLVDGHIYVSDDIPHITGRFYFTHKWKRTPYCFPYAYPDGTIMADHIVQYYGKQLFPVTVAYGGGWLLTLAETYPSLFNSDIDAKNDAENLSLSENLTNTLLDMLSISNSPSNANSPDAADIEEYLHRYLPGCGCIPQ